jgi:DNA-binding XRE family transcriptional regulator
MELRATTLIRNNVMISAREELGWTQMDLAEAAGVSMHWIQAIESLNYPASLTTNGVVEKIAIALQVSPDKICPQELIGVKIVTKKVQVKEVPADHMLEYRDSVRRRLLPPQPEVIADQAIMIEKLGMYVSKLPFWKRVVMESLYGLNGHGKLTHKELSETLHISKEAVKSREKSAIKSLEFMAKRDQFVVDAEIAKQKMVSSIIGTWEKSTSVDGQ